MNKSVTTSSGTVSVSTDGLSALRAELERAKSKRVHVGVLGGKDARAEDGTGYVAGNAEIGMVHEFGVVSGYVRHKSRQVKPGQKRGINETTKKPSMNIPERSFLRMPLIVKLPDAILAQGRDLWRKAILNRGVTFALRNLGVLAESIVQDAFATGGFGAWAALSQSTINRRLKKSNGKIGRMAILVDSAQLRQSVTSRVVG